jgi:hypothetical protein
MPKRIAGILIASFLVLFFIPGLVFGIDVSSNLSLDSAAVGESVTVSGNADANTWISVKAVDSSGNIVFFDAVKSDNDGTYTCTFKIPQLSPGPLTVVSGYGDNVDTKDLTITGGGSGSSSTGHTITSSGGTIDEAGAEINFPAGAVDNSIRVTVKKLTSGLPSIPSGLKSVSDYYEITSNQTSKFKKQVKITLPFDTSKVDTDKDEVGIYSWNNDQWLILDQIEVDTTEKKISGETTHFSLFAVLSKEKAPEVIKPLNDIEGHWAAAEINQMYSSGIIGGYPDGSFKPNNQITRAEFVAILVKAFQLETESSKVFNDTVQHWAKDYIAAAAGKNVVNGYSDELFGPDDFITREQMAVMVVNAAQLTEVTGGKTFTDQDQFSSWAQDAVIIAASNELITGYQDNSFKPKNNATRGEAVTIISRAMQF